jgi:hypothetical protein
MMLERDKSKVDMRKIPRFQRLKHVQYAYVVFRDTESKEFIIDTYKDQIFIVKCANFFCFRNAPLVLKKLFLGNNLKISEPLEPDEIIWENLMYSTE